MFSAPHLHKNKPRISLEVVWEHLRYNPSEISSKLRSELSRRAKFRSKFRDSLASQRIFLRNFGRIETIGPSKVRGNFASSEISSKSPEKPGNSAKFACITFAQYCSLKNTQLMYTVLVVFNLVRKAPCWKAEADRDVVQDSSKLTGISGKMEGENTMEKHLRVFHAHLHIFLWRSEVVELLKLLRHGCEIVRHQS